MSSVFLLCLFLSLSFLIISPSSSTPITLTLSPIPTQKTSLNSWDYSFNIVKTTIQRAYHLKTPKKNKTSSTIFHGTSTNTPLFARSYGGYSVMLAFGTPPQTIPLVFDTGSSLLWVPCTSQYACSNCTFSNIDPTNITTFQPKLSSTTRVIGCRSPKCGWVFSGSDEESRCGPGCGPKCSRGCPGYVLQYGLGSTAGLAISESLDLPGAKVENFLLGCSLQSFRQPEGIAGFGRAPTSLPNQLALGKFSYCLLPHKFDDSPRSSKLILAGRGEKIPLSCLGHRSKVGYTPLYKNPTTPPYNEYYYIVLRKVTVGKKVIKLPYRYLVPDLNGDGGTIVDSGTTLTFMERPLFDPLVKELATQITHYKRANDVEAQSGFGLCFDIKNVTKVHFPKLVFHFKGGAKMLMPIANYFSYMSDLGAWCLTIVTDTSPAAPSSGGPVGPAIILGNYQQQNFYIEYDLEHQRLGIKKQKCDNKR